MNGFLKCISSKNNDSNPLELPKSFDISTEIKSKIAILVPVGSHIEPACDESLRQLEQDGVKVFRKYGFSAIDQGRCVMAQVAIDNGYEHLFWIDSDISFYYRDIYKIINYNLPFVSGVYSIKGWPALTTKFPDEFKEIDFGSTGKLYPVEYTATGFMYTHISVYQKIADKYDMNPVKIWGGQYIVHPWFLPMIIEDSYVGEDFSFCYRARQSGINIYADTTIRLSHIGKYEYSFKFINKEVESEPESIIYKIKTR
jgi:hypothetical protein